MLIEDLNTLQSITPLPTNAQIIQSEYKRIDEETQSVDDQKILKNEVQVKNCVYAFSANGECCVAVCRDTVCANSVVRCVQIVW